MKTYIGGKIHGATITQADLRYQGSITIDRDLLDAAGIDEFERVDVLNVTNGERLTTYTIAGKPGSKVVCMNGAAARRCQVGDCVLILCYRQSERFEGAPVVLMNRDNTIERVERYSPRGSHADS